MRDLTPKTSRSCADVVNLRMGAFSSGGAFHDPEDVQALFAGICQFLDQQSSATRTRSSSWCSSRTAG